MTTRELLRSLGTIRLYAVATGLCFLLFLIGSWRGCRFIGDAVHPVAAPRGGGSHARPGHGFYHK